VQGARGGATIGDSNSDLENIRFKKDKRVSSLADLCGNICIRNMIAKITIQMGNYQSFFDGWPF